MHFFQMVHPKIYFLLRNLYFRSDRNLLDYHSSTSRLHLHLPRLPSSVYSQISCFNHQIDYPETNLNCQINQFQNQIMIFIRVKAKIEILSHFYSQKDCLNQTEIMSTLPCLNCQINHQKLLGCQINHQLSNFLLFFILMHLGVVPSLHFCPHLHFASLLLFYIM